MTPTPQPAPTPATSAAPAIAAFPELARAIRGLVNVPKAEVDAAIAKEKAEKSRRRGD